jgi:2-C-methyl-D-erythritol 4-phosphate cytidylyltransferase
VIVAGGSGTRMGSATPKQFLPLHGKPVLIHTVKQFITTLGNPHLIVVAPENFLSHTEELLQQSGIQSYELTYGGDTRFGSVRNGLGFVKDHGIVFIHDAVRPLVSKTLIERCHKGALESGTAVPVVPAVDSLRLKADGTLNVLDRDNVFLVQTPQTFQSEIILDAFNQSYRPAFTDEATVVETRGTKINFVEGDPNNIKITRPADLQLAHALLG